MPYKLIITICLICDLALGWKLYGIYDREIKSRRLGVGESISDNIRYIQENQRDNRGSEQSIDGNDVVKNELGYTTRKARITKYTWTGNRMANGEYPKDGYVATSDRTIPLGTKISIGSRTYIVGDRTARWVHERFGTTIDIYTEESEEEALQWGVRHDVEVKIYTK